MPLTPETWLDQQTVNTTTDGNQTFSNIIQLSNGNILVSWTSSSDNGVGSPPGTDIIGQIFNFMGEPEGGEIRLNHGNNIDNEQLMDMAATENGHFIGVYEDKNAAGTSLRLQEYDANGSQTSFTTIIFDSNPATPNYLDPHISVSSLTSALVVYTKDTGGGESDIVGKIYNPATNSIGPEISLISFVNNQLVTEPDVTTLNNGNYVITASSKTAGSSDSSIYYQIVNAAGNAVPFGQGQIASTAFDGLPDANPSVTALTGGGFVITWTHANGSDVDGLFQVFNAQGATLGGVQEVENGVINGDIGQTVIPLSDGGFAIFYGDRGTQQVGVKVERFDAAGTQIGSNFLVAAGSVDQPSAILLEDGRMAVSWAQNTNIQMEILDIRDTANAVPAYINEIPYAPGGIQIGSVGADIISAASTISDLAFVYGWDGDDKIYGSDFSDYLIGNNGNDTILGGGGDDFILGGDGSGNGAGNDGNNILGGGDGNDALLGGDGNDKIFGNNGNDTLHGSNGVDSLYGGDGNDTLNGGNGNDYLRGQNGSDKLNGDENDDILIGDAGNDTLRGGNGNDILGGGADHDILWGDAGNDKLYGGAGMDQLYGDNLAGAIGDDLLLGYTGNDILYGGGGIDILGGGDDDDTLYGGDGNDQVFGNNGNDVLIGDSGNDTLYGGRDNDRLHGGIGDDTLFGQTGNDKLYGDDGDDLLGGFTGDDILKGGAGLDRLFGNDGNDLLYGDSGNDTLYGGNGNDVLTGGAGNDLLLGQAGTDTFFFENDFGVDVIADFAHNGLEKINLLQVINITNFADLSANHVSTNTDGFVVIEDGINSITVNGYSLADLSASDFVF